MKAAAKGLGPVAAWMAASLIVFADAHRHAAWQVAVAVACLTIAAGFLLLSAWEGKGGEIHPTPDPETPNSTPPGGDALPTPTEWDEITAMYYQPAADRSIA